MKKSSILFLAAMLTSIVALAGGEDSKSVEYSQNKKTTILQQLPYSSTGTAVMEKVFSKDEYTLWKCPSNYVNNFPGQSITGTEYNYFVYKNDQFHMTVNNNNKEDIYNFLTQ